MSCERIRKWISPYLDSELDASANMDVETHLEHCPECRKFFEQEHRFETILKNSLTTDASTQMKWDKAIRRILDKKKWRPFQLAALTVIFLLTITGGWFQWDRATHDLAWSAITRHSNYTSDKLPLEIRSDSPEEIERFFRNKLSFEVKVPRVLPVPGAKLAGARLCHLKETPVAYLVYYVEQEPISVFLMHQKNSAHFKQIAKAAQKEGHFRQVYTKGNRSVVTCKVPQGIMCLTGSVPKHTLQEIAKNYDNLI